MEGDTARIYQLERNLKRHAEVINQQAKEIDMLKKNTLSQDLALFVLILICCTAMCILFITG